MITKFKDLHYGSSGIVFWYNNKVLLVKPNDPHNLLGGWSYPKGTIDYNEHYKDTALREVEEEIGLKLPKDFLDNTPVEELENIRKAKGIKHYYFYTYILSDEEFNKYFNNNLSIPQNKLQIDEVVEARFMDKEEAKKLLSKKFLGIL
jgi:ADP-ribose pyrophosphatase YjhB (NUDIX family)